jgi:hypothetical protein
MSRIASCVATIPIARPGPKVDDDLTLRNEIPLSYTRAGTLEQRFTSTGAFHGDLLGVRVFSEVKNCALIVIAKISSNIGIRFQGT